MFESFGLESLKQLENNYALTDFYIYTAFISGNYCPRQIEKVFWQHCVTAESLHESPSTPSSSNQPLSKVYFSVVFINMLRMM